jgi:uncharacterized protein (DUF427 family)
MVQARWNGAVIADGDDTLVGEGNHHFPRGAVDVNEDAACHYPDPGEAAAAIRDRIAFWKRVEVG